MFHCLWCLGRISITKNLITSLSGDFFELRHLVVLQQQLSATLLSLPLHFAILFSQNFFFIWVVDCFFLCLRPTTFPVIKALGVQKNSKKLFPRKKRSCGGFFEKKILLGWPVCNTLNNCFFGGLLLCKTHSNVWINLVLFSESQVFLSFPYVACWEAGYRRTDIFIQDVNFYRWRNIANKKKKTEFSSFFF